MCDRPKPLRGRATGACSATGLSFSFKPINAKVGLALLVLAAQPAASAGRFAEGYSSAEPGAPSEVYHRAFTIYSLKEACGESLRPGTFRISPDPIHMRVGDRVHHSSPQGRPSDLVIEAFDAQGGFLPSLPIIVDVTGRDGVVASRSDWEYFEAARAGEDELRVTWACATQDGEPGEASVRILITSGRASKDGGGDVAIRRDTTQQVIKVVPLRAGS